MKKTLFAIFFLYCLHINASLPSGKFVVVLYRGTVCSVNVNVDTVENCLDYNSAQNLIGEGSNNYYLGNLTIVFHKNTSNYPHNLELVCSTYDTSNNEYVAVHTNGISELAIGVQKNFNLSGDITQYAYITHTSAATVIRTIESDICPEEHTLYFYVLESPNNVFIKGTYTCHFLLQFGS